MKKIIKKIKQELKISPDSIHAETHWNRVASFGEYIAKQEELNAHLIILFAYFHDSKRYNDSYDPEHGPRAAEYVKTFTLKELGLNEKEREQLMFACRYHTYEKETGDKDVLACWDADRLDLPRAGITIDLDRLFTETAKDIVLYKIKNIGIKPLKDVDSLNRSLLIKTFFWLFIPFSFVGISYAGFVKGISLSFVSSIVITFFVMFMAKKFSNVVKMLYGGRRNIISTREQLQSVLGTAKLAKMNKNYEKAIGIVNVILLQDPKFYEAMLVKAQILHEGFDNTDSAKKYLNKVITNTKPDDTIHVWSSTLYERYFKRTEGNLKI
jgi:uncharacterized protein